MSAEIIAIGKYSKAIADLVDYPPERYATTREGSIVSRRLFGISEGSSLSREFASFLGIQDPWDFNQHKIDVTKVDIVGLQNWAKVYTDYDEHVEILDGLIRAGFEFHFRPEG